jgi:endo-1,4-beta-xylanase
MATPHRSRITRRATLTAGAAFLTAATTVRGADTPDHAPLRDLADARGIRIGAAVASRPLANEPAYRDTLAREFSSITCENVMKPSFVHATPGYFDFQASDAIVAFAAAHGMTVRGHTLVWHEQNPPWLERVAAVGENPAGALRDHVMGVVRHYRNDGPAPVPVWDVVNEALTDNGLVRDTLWSRALGPRYLADAFRWAHQADPDAHLFYNDFGAEGMGRKANAVHAMLRDLLGDGIPVHGVGLQMHVGIGQGNAPDLDDLAANIGRLRTLGLEVHVTEMDVKLQTGTGSDAARLADQARVYADVLGTCLDAGVTSFTLWGFTDAHSWIPRFTGKPDGALPFNTTYEPKPAYYALARVLAGN